MDSRKLQTEEKFDVRSYLVHGEWIQHSWYCGDDDDPNEQIIDIPIEPFSEEKRAKTLPPFKQETVIQIPVRILSEEEQDEAVQFFKKNGISACLTYSQSITNNHSRMNVLRIQKQSEIDQFKAIVKKEDGVDLNIVPLGNRTSPQLRGRSCPIR